MRYLGFILISLIFLSAGARQVDVLQAQEYATTFLNQLSKEHKIIHYESIDREGILTSHIFHLHPEGFVMIAANDKLEPLLGYSLNSDYMSKELRPDHVEYFFRNTEKNIIEIIKNKDIKSNPKWKEPLNLKSTSAEIEPIIKVNWDQGTGWNAYCPHDKDGPGGRVYVGCVAVAMSQAMSVFQYPEKGIGYTSYRHQNYGLQEVDFNEEAPYDWNQMITNVPNDEIARLLYHAAITVAMDFGADGSGTNSRAAAGGLVKYFDYSKSMKLVERIDDGSDWRNELNENLRQGYSIVYYGDGANGEAGHAWNIDGVDKVGLYHVNWGWGGSMNGYFNLNNFSPGSYNFTQNQGAILSIRPKVPGPTDIKLDNLEVKEKKPVGTFVGKVNVVDEFPDNPYTYKLKGKYVLFTQSHKEASFYIENDSLKTAEVFDFGKEDEYELYIEATDTLGNSLEEMFTISIVSTVDAPTIEVNNFELFPNPFKNELRIKSDEPGELSLYNLAGKKVLTTFIYPANNQLNVSSLTPGVYLAHFKGEESVWYRKVTKK